jgi:FlaA1/EpsC-like NDP-sugar epimerase
MTIKSLFSFQNGTPRWIVFTADAIMVTCSLLLAYLLRFNFSIPVEEAQRLPSIVLFFLLIRIVFFFVYKTYAGIIRYTSTRDAVRIFFMLMAGSLVFGILNVIRFVSIQVYFLPISIIILEYIISVFTLIVFRIIVKSVYAEMRLPSSERTGVVIYGAGQAGIIAKHAIDRDAGTKYKVIAFIDDDPKKKGRYIEGIPVYHAPSELEDLLRANPVKHLILAIQNISAQRKKEIIESCLNYDTKVLNVPPVSSWINGELSFKQIKKIKIEDLLERDPIQLDVQKIKSEVAGKIILITGAAGSIGSEIVRQLIAFSPERIIMLDNAESPLYELELEILEQKKFLKAESVIADVRNAERMRNVFKTFQPDIVFHAAAYKHVPMMENNPSEGILTNVSGTKVCADLAHEFKAERFVMISTDKAVNPTGIMGATKRIAEIYIQALNKQSATQFITTRFGNVLDSNGSVIPRFKKQIEERLPVTVTHPEVTRYFMTIPEACQLVLEAAAMGKGGEIFLFDMGKPVKIVDLARKMIKLSGLTLGKDIQIVFTGLRPGEKLYEELLADDENTIETHHPKILIAKVREYEFENISSQIRELIGLFDTQNNEVIVARMKQIVPEFISTNSVFTSLDQQQEMLTTQSDLKP